MELTEDVPFAVTYKDDRNTFRIVCRSFDMSDGFVCFRNADDLALATLNLDEISSIVAEDIDG